MTRLDDLAPPRPTSPGARSLDEMTSPRARVCDEVAPHGGEVVAGNPPKNLKHKITGEVRHRLNITKLNTQRFYMMVGLPWQASCSCGWWCSEGEYRDLDEQWLRHINSGVIA